MQIWRKLLSKYDRESAPSETYELTVMTSITPKIMVKSTNRAQIRVQRVKICKNMCFVFSFTSLRFLTVFQTVISTRSWWRGTLVCNPKQTHEPKKTICQFEENCLKITTVSVPNKKTYKITVMTSSKQNFEKLKKVSSQIFVKIIWVNFERIWSKIAEIINPDTQTHTHTHAQTGLIPWVKIFSPEMTEYKTTVPRTSKL